MTHFIFLIIIILYRVALMDYHSTPDDAYHIRCTH